MAHQPKSRFDRAARHLPVRSEHLPRRKDCSGGPPPPRGARLPGAGRRGSGDRRHQEARGLARHREVAMRAFQKFDPYAHRSALPSPLPSAKAAKVAKAGSRSSRFSSFSNFSRVTSPTRDSWTAAEWQAYFDERAAMREYEGGLSRPEAERLAFDDTVQHWLSTHPAPA